MTGQRAGRAEGFLHYIITDRHGSFPLCVGLLRDPEVTSGLGDGFPFKGQFHRLGPTLRRIGGSCVIRGPPIGKLSLNRMCLGNQGKVKVTPESIGYIPPTKAEAHYYRQLAKTPEAA